jgi:cytidylate kinase/NTP pyrophosphatase (non-canonical NTP hydrolase)
VNGDDVELLGKLGFILDISEYGKLEKTSEVHDQYSYIEKIAGIPKAVVKAVDKGDAFSGEFLKDMDYSIPKGYEMKGDLCCPVEKKAAADPSQTILITGHSGSGKTTLSRQLAEKLNVPVRRVDAHRGWDNYIRGDDKRWKETLTPGTKEHSYFTELVHRATKDTLKNAPEAGIIEGTQLGHLSPEELAKFKAHIVVGGDRDQSILQRIQRSVDKASKNGITFSPEEMDTKRIKAKYVADFWEPGIEKFRKLPGVIHYNHTEHEIEPLIKRLQGLLQKKAELAKAGNVSKEAKGRCWEGYKPVKGKKPYSEDSCEPVAKKEAEYKWYKSKDLHRDVTNGRHYPFSYLTGEAKELVDAVKNRDMANFKEEIGDTSYAAQMLLAQATGLNHPVFADLSKFHDREKVWKDMFKEKGGTYHPKHMEGGSNYAKASKIIKAFQSAGIKVDQKEAERLANHYTGGKMEKEAGMPDWLRRAIRNNDKSTLSSAGKAGARVRARNLAAKKSKDELRRMLDMGAEAVPKIIHPPSAYNVQPPLPGI